FILPLLTAGSQWIQQRMMTPPTDDPQQRMQNSMMQFMPLMMLWFGTTIAAGVVLYWLTQNVAGIVQQYFQSGWGSLNLPKMPWQGREGAGAVAVAGADGVVAGDARNGSTAVVPAGSRSPSRGASGGQGGQRDGGGSSGGQRSGGPSRRQERRASGKR